MTETTFPFSAVEPTSPDADTPDKRRLALVLGGGLLAVALVGAAVFTSTGGEDEFPLGGVNTPVAAATADAPQDAVAQAQTVPVSNTDATARSPFEPKYVAPAPVPEAEPQAEQPAQAPVDVPGSEPQVLVPVLDAPPGTPPGPVDPRPAAPVAPREYRLVLTGVSTDGGVPTAQFTIDGAVSSVKATEIFGPQRQLLLRSLQQGPKDGQWTATIQVGDARPIDVVTNEAVYVQ